MGQNDLDIVKKVQNGEMSQGEIKYYLADAKTKKEIDSAKKEESEFDSDLNRSMYQEYWTDLKEFKTKKQMREAARKAN